MKMTAEFSPEAMKSMSEAYENACRSIHDWGQPVIMREVIARRIIQLARTGDRDPDQLCERALKSLGFSECPTIAPR